MTEDIYFLDEGQVKITAASVGISRQRWTGINENEIENDNYIDLMKSKRFDHLPIISSNGNILEYFKTKNPNNFSSVKRHIISYDDVIPLDTNIKDVIDKFSSTKRTFYFLTFHKNISGLITLGNLNCRQVQVFVFNLICELERELGDFINDKLNDIEIENWVKSKSKKPKDKYSMMIKSFKKLASVDLENQLTEHFYFVNFLNLINERKLFKKMNYSEDEWKDYDMNDINEIRKRVAHPTKSSLDKDNNIYKLKERLNKIDDLIFRLTTLKRTAAINNTYT